MFYRIDGFPTTRTETEEKDEQKETSGRRILCRACGYYITSTNQKRSMGGKTTHVCKNPAGYVFTIICFSSAPGCLVTGEPTEEYTWFAGYLWSYALCANCLEHLGWFYDSGKDTFFGLIVNKLREETE